MRFVFSFAFDKLGRSRPARIAIIAITTSNSIRVKAPAGRPHPGTEPRRPTLSLLAACPSTEAAQQAPRRRDCGKRAGGFGVVMVARLIAGVSPFRLVEAWSTERLHKALPVPSQRRSSRRPGSPGSRFLATRLNLPGRLSLGLFIAWKHATTLFRDTGLTWGWRCGRRMSRPQPPTPHPAVGRASIAF